MHQTFTNKYDYDLQNDSIFFYVKGKKYKSSIEFDGIVLDLNEDADIINLEILDASKKFNASKPELLNIKHFDAVIEVTKENIKVTMKLEVLKRNKLFPKVIEALTANILNLPSSIQGIAVTC
ncbi:MAG: hypothetical protein MPEBLZ_00928 [Candidatus Methanoperedens nitroreducens]|uniref:DUF2283 domain-containing protein n=1 Tax=Candidatus Methanoperedens nitratireducens TaxID=1392998 RepID=A0A0P8CM92_9EURY|nr:DUF2283 domain-containing protein [Candidatus Methanoperedens sp. BLZ2]KAB2940462.1 MAG: DUF2283 domain-containing protein [Candidatus Methanoperedens sp.]KPQ44508.1 MAG: hypothetical protein MPEBLZ_00928 [Candidatus Methanoperedens sp. BLZ1]MBZ0174129.1 DUF2283 domain-containing protein [Candidatus Methanoperedens nitroreducens]CAG0994381.1 hypothetical protein METP2_02816 [Methanosarcinales archaeon]MCX9079610.1 DUF2283 domain-containing protein [Candidatus Methanoperedens sp.]